jgi:hypothetical protein
MALAAVVVPFDAPGPPPTSGPNAIVLPDAELYTKGLYSAYAAPFSAEVDKRLKRGVDYYDTITLNPRRFPDETLFDMRWPARSDIPTGVWGFHALSFGNYGGGPVDKLIPPRRARDIRVLTATFDYSHGGSDNFNLLTEFFLTSRPGDASARVWEIGFLLHVPSTTKAFMDAGQQLGTFSDAQGKSWRLVRKGSYFMVSPADGRTVRRGILDYGAVLRRLRKTGAIGGNEWFNGIAFGAEPTLGGGRTWLLVHHWRVTYR